LELELCRTDDFRKDLCVVVESATQSSSIRSLFFVNINSLADRVNELLYGGISKMVKACYKDALGR